MTLAKSRALPAFVATILVIALAAGAWRARNEIRGNLVALDDLLFHRAALSAPGAPVEGKLIAHAGGAMNGIGYTNSREALDAHYAAGYRVFELDFDWTSDGYLVLVHDWAKTSWFAGVPAHVFSYAEYTRATRRDGLHSMTFGDLRAWLVAHRDALVVTDTKASNLRLLTWLQANGGQVLPQLIVQIYCMAEMPAARRLQPRAVWLTVYRYGYPAWGLERVSGVDAFVIPVESYARYRKMILAGRARFYVHSVAANAIDETYRRCPGIYGVYVD
jgi:glycerophosphoryl diester phosphodiesterase